MRMEFFGDSFDIVKKQMIRWLPGFPGWSAHPMFTDKVTKAETQAYSAFLGVRLLNVRRFTPDSDRLTFLTVPEKPQNVFFDPDTGIAEHPKSGQFRQNPHRYLLLEEVVRLVTQRPENLTMVFDKSVPRGGEREAIRKKLDAFHSEGIYGIAYVAQAPFWVLTKNPALMDIAFGSLTARDRIPTQRMLRAP